MEYNIDEIRNSLKNAFLEMELEQEKIDDAIFHLADWLSDLKKWNKFCENPTTFTPEEASSIVIDFLVHVPAHLAAASKLVTGLPVSDVFGIGATTEEKF